MVRKAICADTLTWQLRRQARERREFLHRREVQARERQIHERKQAVKDALAAGKKPSGDGVASATDPTAAEDMALDDEYAEAGIEDPKILVTTSRAPSSKLGQFAKEIRLCLPNAHRINRGGYTMAELADACRANDFTDLIVLHEHRGVPDALVLSHFPHGPTVLFTLHNVALRHDLPGDLARSTVSEQYPHLIFEDFTSPLGKRIKSCLRFLFPVPREDSKRVMTFANERDFIAFRHHVFVPTSHKEVQLAEVGPRFEMRRACDARVDVSDRAAYEIRQGTIDNTTADVEWVLRRASTAAAAALTWQHTCARPASKSSSDRSSVVGRPLQALYTRALYSASSR